MKGMTRGRKGIERNACVTWVNVPETLHTSIGKHLDPVSATASSRRVSFGTVPDFTYSGKGVRLDDVRAGTPAALAGAAHRGYHSRRQRQPVEGMRAYSDALKKLDPGDEIRVRFLRDGIEQTLQHTGNRTLR